jgi:hypothetical protein
VGEQFDRARATEEIRRILLSYPEHSDTGNVRGVGELYAGVEMGPPGEAAVQHTDPAEGERIYRSHVRYYDDGLSHAKHLITNIDIRFDEGGETASSTSFFVVLQAHEGFPLQIITAGRYEDRFARVDGRWRLTARHDHMEQIGDLTRHLSDETLAMIGLGPAPAS